MAAGLVVDTNVVCAGLITPDPQSPTARIVDRVLAGQAGHVLSLALLGEYEKVLLRPALVRLHGLNAAEVEQLLASLARHARLLEPEGSELKAPDPGDQHLWDLLAAETTLRLVTGDKRLLADASMAGRVISPADEAGRW